MLRHKTGFFISYFKFVFVLAISLFLFQNAVWAIVEPGLTNAIGNASFENALGPATGGESGNWDNTPGRGLSTLAVTGAPDGSKVLQIEESGFTNSGPFTFQVASTTISDGTFVSFSAYARFSVIDGVDDAQLKIEFKDRAGVLLSSVTQSISGTSFSHFTVSGIAPSPAAQAVFVISIEGADAGGTTTLQVDNAVGTISRYPIVFDTSLSKSKINKGSAAFVSVRAKNVSNVAINGMDLIIAVPEGFNFIDSGSRLEGAPVNVRNGSKIINIGSIATNESKQIGFLLGASAGVQIGKKYEVSFFVRDSTGLVRSDVERVVITIVADPLFDEGVIVGKVFDDRDENKIQGPGEKGVPGVKLATEEGIVVITDRHGRFSIPAIKPGRHVVKIDGHTLPQNTKFITEESVLIKSTEGMFNVVNFAVKMPESQIPEEYRKQLDVLVTQGNDFIPPKLDIWLEPSVLRLGIGVFEKDPIFFISTNYSELVAGWRIEVRDEYGDEVWTGFGIGAPPTEAPWDGRTKKKESVKPGVYSYRLIVHDQENREDWTPLGYFRVVSKLDQNTPDYPAVEVPATGNMKIDEEGKRSIPTSARPRVEVRGTTVPWNSIMINGDQVGVNLDGSFQTEIYLPAGNHSILVTSTDPEGNAISYEEEVQVKDSYFFMVGLGEEELGTSILDGNVEVLGEEDTFDHGFYEDGRLAFYLKGKLKGKFLVTARYDTDDPRQELFENLDPDQYYPVYGDDSEIQYDGYDTKQRLYLLVEMDRSYVKWGSYNTNFTETELATHNRTFSGFKTHFRTLKTTKYGDAARGFTAYTSDVDQLADHNEFLGTGGSLFYLRNKNVISGSDKVRVEVRDKIQQINVYSKDLVYGTDYEIDYSEGRIILAKPLSAVSYSDTIISNDILNGSETYLIVDYEFEPQGEVSDRNSGIRGYTHMGDHFKLGGTAIEDRQPGGDYDLRGIDVTGRFGRNTKITAEYAKSKGRTQRNSVSYNGGLTFEDLTTGVKALDKSTREFDDAYSVKAQTKLRTGTELSAYAQTIEPGFSNADLIRQAGTRKAGLEVRQKVGENTQLSYRFDRQKSTDPENRVDLFVQSPEEQKVHTVQSKTDYGPYLLIAEYKNQHVDAYDISERGISAALDDVQFGNVFGAKAGYRISKDVMPYMRGQTTFGGKSEPNHQIGAGVEASVLKGKGTVYVEEMVGNIGDSTRLGFDVKTSDATSVYTNMKTGPVYDGSGRALSTTVGSSTQVNAKSRFYSEREYATYQRGEQLANILGYESQLSDRWGYGASFERAMLYDIEDVNTHRNSGAFEVRYTNKDILKIISRYELRYYGGTDDQLQWFFRDTLNWKINEDWRYSLRFNRSDANEFFGRSRFGTNASFTELNTGFAYRPVDHNRLNVLTRYTWLSEVGASQQFDTPDIFGIEDKETSHIFGIEGGYEVLPPFLGLVQKLAYKRSSIEVEDDAFYNSQFLWVNRFNFHVTRKWDLVLEYRLLWDFELLKAMKHGVLIEVEREFLDYIHLGAGYNFTDFDDDLRSSNTYSHHGFFTRLSGKF